MTFENSVKDLSGSPSGDGGLTPKQLGYYFPAEFAQHKATWLSWPHKEESWPGKIDKIYPNYSLFIKYLSQSEKVCINVNDEAMKNFALEHISKAGADLNNIEFFFNPTDDAWCRDHGPAFLVRRKTATTLLRDRDLVIVDWDYNAWGNKYPPFDKDDIIPTLIAKQYDIPVYHPGIIMEGGSVDFNGNATLITSKSCLLNENRNKGYSQEKIEWYLYNYYGVDQVLWIDDGIVGDDTDGHVDDTVRFFNEDSVIAVVEDNRLDPNHQILQHNMHQLKQMRLLSGKQLNIVELPMPDEVVYRDQRLPASYANFYICNKYVIVPVFRCAKDDWALDIISDCFPSRDVIGIDSTDIIWGLGSFHCLSQQEPEV